MGERIKTALEKPIQLGEIKEASLTDVVNLLAKKVDDGIMFPRSGEQRKTISRRKGEMPLGAWLQMVEDSIDGLRFVVRDLRNPGNVRGFRAGRRVDCYQQFWKQAGEGEAADAESRTRFAANHSAEMNEPGS